MTKLDRDIPFSVWNRYLKEIQTKFKVKYHKDTGEAHIPSRIGEVQVHSILQEKLVFCLYGNHPQIKTILKSNNLFKCTMEGDQEANFIFDVKNLIKVSKILRLHVRRTYTPEEKEHLRTIFSKNVLKK